MAVTEILTLIFVVLKLIGKINWTWGQVLIPTFIDIGIAVTLIIMKIILTLKKK